mgnify:CR=1 FL=1
MLFVGSSAAVSPEISSPRLRWPSQSPSMTSGKRPTCRVRYASAGRPVAAKSPLAYSCAVRSPAAAYQRGDLEKAKEIYAYIEQGGGSEHRDGNVRKSSAVAGFSLDSTHDAYAADLRKKKVRTSVHFKRPSTLRLARSPKCPTKVSV